VGDLLTWVHRPSCARCRWSRESRRVTAARSSSAVPWEYEPRTFVLERATDGRLLEAVTPDFYLPHADVYVECTEMEPALMCAELGRLRAKYGRQAA
jgi:hypothetical protein